MKVMVAVIGFGVAIATLAVVESSRVEATPSLARQTGKSCGTCHVGNPADGKLNSTGRSYR